MAYNFPKDGNGKTGVVRGIKNNTDFIVPTDDVLKIKESSVTSTTNKNHTFLSPMTEINVANDSETDFINFTINGINIVVGPNETFTGRYEEFTNVVFYSNGASYRFFARGY